MFIVKTIPSGTAREGPAAGSRHLRCSAIPAVNALPQPAALEAHCRLGRSLPGLSVEGAGHAGGLPPGRGAGLLRDAVLRDAAILEPGGGCVLCGGVAGTDVVLSPVKLRCSLGLASRVPVKLWQVTFEVAGHPPSPHGGTGERDRPPESVKKGEMSCQGASAQPISSL